MGERDDLVLAVEQLRQAHDRADLTAMSDGPTGDSGDGRDP
jgi:hypothetical protein